VTVVNTETTCVPDLKVGCCAATIATLRQKGSATATRSLVFRMSSAYRNAASLLARDIPRDG
jgi:hypothetical protein